MTDDPRKSPEFRAYERAREAVLRMKNVSALPGGVADPSTYWAEELGNIDYLLEASPLIVRKLRHHAFHITGIRPYDYRETADGRRDAFEARLRALHAMGGDTLLVPEAPALGGFGYDVGGRLLNVDTLKFYESLIAMERGGALAVIRARERPVVCEVGAGWGGFAYQFKTLFPRARYVIVDFPELFLFSATYLATLFPGASLLFCEDPSPTAITGWADADFVFVPHTLAPAVASLPLDLTVNMVSFQEMTDAQVRGYAEMAARARCPWLYSLNRERSRHNRELASVSAALAGRYRLTEIPMLGTDYSSAMKRPPKPGRAADRAEAGYRHLVGRLDDAAAAEPEGGTASAGSTPAPGFGASIARDAGADAGGRAPAPGPSVVLGMTLYNNAGHLREAMESLLAQTFGDFVLILLDDASADGTGEIAREYAARDSRVRYFRHASRQAMIATWREVAEIGGRECPSATFFAWVSDHDRWHPDWLRTLVGELRLDPTAVLAYPITRRIDAGSAEVDRGERRFDTAAFEDRRERWNYFCREAVGSGDMVYGLMRYDALRQAGIFRTVLRPDRLLMTELTLLGRIRQAPHVLWFRRFSDVPSIARQASTLVLSGQEPRWFGWPPAFQHVRVLYREYVRTDPPRFGLTRATWLRMLLRYQTTYGWRHFRKSETFHSINRGLDNAVWAKKRALHHYRHAVYDVLVGLRAARGRLNRQRRQIVYRLLVSMHGAADATGERARAATDRARAATQQLLQHLHAFTRRP